jgi:hypothetical protein
MSHYLSVENHGITITSKSSKSEGWKVYSVGHAEVILKRGKVIRQYLLREILSETEWRATLLDEHKINN